MKKYSTGKCRQMASSWFIVGNKIACPVEGFQTSMSRLLQSNSTSATFLASSTMETLRSEEPQPSCVEPSYRQHSPKRATAFTPGWPVCRVQQVCLWQVNFAHTCLPVCESFSLTNSSVLLPCRQHSVPGGLGAFAAKDFK